MLAKKALGGAPASVPGYVEDVFSTYLYTGNATNRSFVNGVDLAGEGGMVWIKRRSPSSASVIDHCITDTVRGKTKYLSSNSTSGETTRTDTITDFNADGFSIGTADIINYTNDTIASWSFRKAEKFFDVVTYTGTGSARTVSHNLGSTPGCIIVKCTSQAGNNWFVYHTSLGATKNLKLNLTSAEEASSSIWNNTAPTSTVFTVGSSVNTNESGQSYVAYLFAHDAGGFGDAGDQSVIKCGSYTGNGSATGPTITLDWEPQWVLIKQATQSGTRWTVTDNMRGFPASSSGQNILQPHVTDAEVGVAYIQPTSTGFKVVDTDADVNNSGETYIYIAIRRGPMKTPEVGTDVFKPVTYTGNGSTNILTTGFPVDFIWNRKRTAGAGSVMDRLRDQKVVRTESTDTESAIGTYGSTTNIWRNNTGISFGSSGADGLNESGASAVVECFRRAPGFFDIVCYTGTGSATTVTHNLGVAPELIIVKPRDQTLGWPVWNSTIYAANADNILYLNETGGQQQVGTMWNSSSPTSTSFPVGTNARTNGSAKTFVAYLFASCPGVSKIGSVSYSGSAVNVDCGFTSSARFVLIKRSNDTGAWAVYDTARGIVAGSDPYLYMNTSNAEDYDGAEDCIDTYSSGFTIATGFANIFGTGTFIYLAIA